MSDWQTVYAAIARNLREFGYDDVRPEMIRETHVAMKIGAELPHGIIGMFAADQLREAESRV